MHTNSGAVPAEPVGGLPRCELKSLKLYRAFTPIEPALLSKQELASVLAAIEKLPRSYALVKALLVDHKNLPTNVNELYEETGVRHHETLHAHACWRYRGIHLFVIVEKVTRKTRTHQRCQVWRIERKPPP